MRRLIVPSLSLLFIAILLLAPAGCKRRKRPVIKAAEEEPGMLATAVDVADPRAAVQLVRGFHDVEQKAWRWTTGKFAVTLRPPRGSSQKGATLALKFTIPEAVIAQLHSLQLSAKVNGYGVSPETYTRAGDYVYLRDVPSSALSGNAVTVDFALDKSLAPTAAEQRELGVIVSRVGFESK